MKLSEAVNRIVQVFGKEIIAERRFIYMIADYYSFRDNPAEKRVLSALVNDGYSARLLMSDEDCNLSLVTNRIVEEACNNYGFREKLVEDVLLNIVKGIGENILKVHSSIDVHPVNHDTEKHSPISLKNYYSKKDCEYSEDYILRMYPKMLGGLQYHAHMTVEKFKNRVCLEDDEACKLFDFLVKIGAYNYNYYSQDYDKTVDTEKEFRNKYRNYIIRQNGVHIIMEKVAKKLILNNIIHPEQITKELLTSLPREEKEEFSKEIFKTLQSIQIIDEKGRLLNPYLTPKSIADKVIVKIFGLSREFDY